MAGWDGEAEDEISAVMVCVRDTQSIQYAFTPSEAHVEEV